MLQERGGHVLSTSEVQSFIILDIADVYITPDFRISAPDDLLRHIWEQEDHTHSVAGEEWIHYCIDLDTIIPPLLLRYLAAFYWRSVPFSTQNDVKALARQPWRACGVTNPTQLEKLLSLEYLLLSSHEIVLPREYYGAGIFCMGPSQADRSIFFDALFVRSGLWTTNLARDGVLTYPHIDAVLIQQLLASPCQTYGLWPALSTHIFPSINSRGPQRDYDHNWRHHWYSAVVGFHGVLPMAPSDIHKSILDLPLCHPPLSHQVVKRLGIFRQAGVTTAPLARRETAARATPAFRAVMLLTDDELSTEENVPPPPLTPAVRRRRPGKERETARSGMNSHGNYQSPSRDADTPLRMDWSQRISAPVEKRLSRVPQAKPSHRPSPLIELSSDSDVERGHLRSVHTLRPPAVFSRPPRRSQELPNDDLDRHPTSSRLLNSHPSTYHASVDPPPPQYSHSFPLEWNVENYEDAYGGLTLTEQDPQVEDTSRSGAHAGALQIRMPPVPIPLSPPRREPWGPLHPEDLLQPPRRLGEDLRSLNALFEEAGVVLEDHRAQFPDFRGANFDFREQDVLDQDFDSDGNVIESDSDGVDPEEGVYVPPDPNVLGQRNTVDIPYGSKNALPTTIVQFCDTFKEMLDVNPTDSDQRLRAAMFMLTGCQDAAGEDVHCLVSDDRMGDISTPACESFVLTADIDSLRWLMDNPQDEWPLTGSLQLYPYWRRFDNIKGKSAYPYTDSRAQKACFLVIQSASQTHSASEEHSYNEEHSVCHCQWKPHLASRSSL